MLRALAASVRPAAAARWPGPVAVAVRCERRPTGVFIDADNVSPGLAERALADAWGDAGLSLRAVRAYKDWSMETGRGRGARRFGELGVELVQVGRLAGKNSSDIRIALDVMEGVLGEEGLRHVVLVTSDADFRHVMQRVREHGCTSTLYHACGPPALLAAADRSWSPRSRAPGPQK